MEHCSIKGCREKAVFICKGSHEAAGFCKDHFKEHQNVPGEHQNVDYSQMNIVKKENYNVEGDEEEKMENIMIFQIDGKGFLLGLNVVDMCLPEDLQAGYFG